MSLKQDYDWPDTSEPTPADYRELQAQYEQLQTMLFNQKLQTKRVQEALQELMSAIGGGQKSCGHQFECVCPFDQAKAALSASEPVVLEGLDAIISRRADIEQRLFNVANGKAPMLTKTDCRIMALRLGTPKDQWTDIVKKHKWGE